MKATIQAVVVPGSERSKNSQHVHVQKKAPQATDGVVVVTTICEDGRAVVVLFSADEALNIGNSLVGCAMLACNGLPPVVVENAPARSSVLVPGRH